MLIDPGRPASGAGMWPRAAPGAPGPTVALTAPCAPETSWRFSGTCTGGMREGESQNYLAVVVQRTQGSPYCDLMFADGYSWTHVPHNRIGLRVDGPVALAIHRAHFAASAASRSAAECYGKAFAAAHSCFVDFNLQL